MIGKYVWEDQYLQKNMVFKKKYISIRQDKWFMGIVSANMILTIMKFGQGE